MNIECYLKSNSSLNSKSIDRFKIGKQLIPIISFLNKTYFKKIKVPGSLIRVYLVENLAEERIDKPIKSVRSWTNFFMYYDIERLLQLKDDLSVKKEIITILKVGIQRVVNEMGWEINPILEVFNEIDSLNYQFIETSKKMKYKGVKEYIQLETVCEPGFYHYYLLVKENDKLISKHKVVTLNAFYNLFFEGNRILSEMKWEDENTFVILGKKGELTRIRFEYSLDSDSLKTRFNLEPEVEADFLEEFDLATTEDPIKIDRIVSNQDVNKWHIYI